MFNRLKEDIDSVFARDPAARHTLEVLFCYPGLHAILMHRATHFLWKTDLKFIARFLSMMSRLLTGVEIHPGATIGRRFFIDHGMGVVIGETAKIGNDVTIYHDVTLGGTSWDKGIRHPQIGNGVIIGAGAQLLGPIHIGDNARIGSNAVVVKDVAAGETVVGVPAHVVEQKVVPLEQKFDAYATSTEAPDPVMDELHKELKALKARVQELEAQNAEGAATAKGWEG